MSTYPNSLISGVEYLLSELELHCSAKEQQAVQETASHQACAGVYQ